MTAACAAPLSPRHGDDRRCGRDGLCPAHERRYAPTRDDADRLREVLAAVRARRVEAGARLARALRAGLPRGPA